jgi:hypothetical protein
VPGPDRVEQHDAARERGIDEQPVEEPGPAVVERDLRADLVRHLQPRREAGFDRVLRKEPLRERVQRRDRGAVELVERALRDGGRRRYERGLLQRLTDPVAQLGRRLLREGDRRDLAHRHAADDERVDAVDERLRLPRARASLDEQRVIEAFDDRAARDVVFVVEQRGLRRVERHSSPPSASAT